MFLEVAEDNAAARALYDALGFEEVGVRPGYYERPGGTSPYRADPRPCASVKIPRARPLNYGPKEIPRARPPKPAGVGGLTLTHGARGLMFDAGSRQETCTFGTTREALHRKGHADDRPAPRRRAGAVARPRPSGRRGAVPPRPRGRPAHLHRHGLSHRAPVRGIRHPHPPRLPRRPLALRGGAATPTTTT